MSIKKAAYPEQLFLFLMFNLFLPFPFLNPMRFNSACAVRHLWVEH